MARTVTLGSEKGTLRQSLQVVGLGLCLTLTATVVHWHVFRTLPVEPRVPERLLLVVAAGWSFLLAGWIARRVRVWSGVGNLMLVIGGLWLLKEAMVPPPTHSFVFLFERLALGAIAQILLTFPSGRPIGWERPAAAVWYGWITTTWLAEALFQPGPWPRSCTVCRPHVLFVRADPRASDLVTLIGWLGVAVMSAVIVGVLARRWVVASRVERRQISAFGLAMVPILVAAVLIPAAGSVVGLPVLTARQSVYLGNLPLTGLPLVILGELLRSRLSHARVADLVRTLDRPIPPAELESELARTLGDPTLRLAFRAAHEPGSLHGVDGRPVAGSREQEDRAMTDVGGPDALAVMLHDRALDQDLVRAAATAAGLSLDNARLQAEVRAQLEELRHVEGPARGRGRPGTTTGGARAV